MSRLHINILLFLVFIGFCAFKMNGKYVVSFPKEWPEPYYDYNKKPLTNAEIALGRHLFYDPILSKDSTISCASCHLSYTAFTHVDHALSHGIGDSIGTRNAPALMNLAWQKDFMWDGSATHIEFQALAPITNPLEMGSDIKEVVEKLNHNGKYLTLLLEAYDDSVWTSKAILKSLAAFQLTFISKNSKYDMLQEKQTVYTEMEAKGYEVFKANCNSCHREPLFSTYNFETNHLSIDPELKDSGRYKVTQNINDLYRFKIPSLRNLKYSFPYMHDGRFKSLNEVIDHYNKQVLEKPLTANEKVELIAFLNTLNDKQFVFNREYGFPK